MRLFIWILISTSVVVYTILFLLIGFDTAAQKTKVLVGTSIWAIAISAIIITEAFESLTW